MVGVAGRATAVGVGGGGVGALVGAAVARAPAAATFSWGAVISPAVWATRVADGRVVVARATNPGAVVGWRVRAGMATISTRPTSTSAAAAPAAATKISVRRELLSA